MIFKISKIFEKNLITLEIGNPDKTANVINIPESKQQIEDLYKSFFRNINLNNTLNGVSLLQESSSSSEKNTNKKAENNYEKIEMPSEGIINTKPEPVVPKIIGFDPTKKAETVKVPSQEELKKIKKEEENIQINKKLYEGFPRNKIERPHETTDNEEKKRIEELKKIEFEKNKQKFSKGFSFLQKQSSDESDTKDSERLPEGGNYSNLDKLIESNLAGSGKKMSN